MGRVSRDCKAGAFPLRVLRALAGPPRGRAGAPSWRLLLSMASLPVLALALTWTRRLLARALRGAPWGGAGWATGRTGRPLGMGTVLWVLAALQAGALSTMAVSL